MRGVLEDGKDDDCEDDGDKRVAGGQGDGKDDDCDGDGGGKDDDCEDDGDKRVAGGQGGGKDDDCDGDGGGKDDDCEDDGDKRVAGGQHDDGQHDDGKDDDGKDDDGKDDDGKDDDCDNGGKKPGQLKLVKVVVNDDGGIATPADWDLQVEVGGVWTTLTQNTFHELPAGSYRIRETGGPAGYEPAGVVCVGSGSHDDDDDDKRSGSAHPSGDRVVITKGAKVVCTFTNDDVPSAPTIGKTSDGLVPVGPGPVWQVAYLLTVDNSGQPHPATYTLFDVPGFPSGVTIDAVSVVDVTGGNAPVPWNGQPATPIVSGVDIAAGASHVYRVVFTISLTGAVVPGDGDCQGVPGQGLFNSATLEWDGGTGDADACEPLPSQPVFDKAALGATAVDVDTWSLGYRLSVANPGPGAAEYTLDDTLGALPAGVTLVEAQAAADPGFPLTPDPLVTSWADFDPVTLALDEPIAPGTTHAFLVTVIVDVDVPALPDPLPADCADIPGVGYPIPNLGSIDIDGIVVDDEACNVIQAVDLGIVKSHSTLEGDAVEPGTPFTYYLDVTNHGTVDVIDGVVTDEIPAELDVLSVTVPAGWTNASSGNTVLVQDVALVVGETERISVEVVVPEVAPPAPPVLPPGADTEPFTPEFIGDLVNEACVVTPGDGNPANDCDTDTVSVDQLVAELFVSCLNDIASLNYRVATSPSLAGQPISFTWAPVTQDPAPNPANVQRTLSSGDSGTILWPGGRLAPNDVSIQWPGYRPLTIADYDVATGALLVDPALVYNGMVLDTSYPTYPWRLASTVTISVNPTLVFQTSYPPQTANCEVPRSADLVIEKTATVQATAPGASFRYGLTVSNLAVDSVADPVVVTDVIPADLRVDSITTSQTAFPRWRDCAVSGTDAAGFGGTLECTLLGPLAMGTSAPPITLGVTVSDGVRVSSITNTGEVCWGPAANGLPYQACDDDSVTVKLSAGGALPATGGTVPAAAAALGIAGVLLGILAVLFASRRRSILTPKG
ncbi:LPXTG cell wall anchor domain-containing protein [Microbacterium atlanticum]|uniref:prealbumin-like fold domain-containing protein n=1 Tax=Microbacterium atlanticum TaxID=2782168 RepID=UPI00188766DB|nr:LPXTG cell wall anchor domain-containing protein [Microbacterium atlanticum]